MVRCAALRCAALRKGSGRARARTCTRATLSEVGKAGRAKRKGNLRGERREPGCDGRTRC
eukprot:3930001-Pleurochrysis_carterae.AAC.3